jgi:hypothetical protein
LIPPYIVLTQPQGRFSENGFLSERYRPFATGGDPAQARFAVEGVVAQGVTDKRQQDRRQLLHQLNTLEKARADAAWKDLDQAEQQAYELILGDAGKVFDLAQEKDEMRDRYGRNTFGQSCLAARRLVERGVPYVTINYQGWDTHRQNFQTMRQKLPQMDKGLATLLQDLDERGLLASTMVWWSGEFGRTPRVQWEAPWNGGRNHWGDCFCALVAGGGFKGGHVVGSTDARGEQVRDRPVYPADVIGSILSSFGHRPGWQAAQPAGIGRAGDARGRRPADGDFVRGVRGATRAGTVDSLTVAASGKRRRFVFTLCLAILRARSPRAEHTACRLRASGGRTTGHHGRRRRWAANFCRTLPTSTSPAAGVDGHGRRTMRGR